MVRRLLRLIPRALALVPAVALGTGAVSAQQPPEEIVSYEVRLDVARTGTIEVTEVIVLRAGGVHFLDGLVRSIPTAHWREGGIGWVQLPFTFRSATMDGSPATYAVKATGGAFGRGGVRIAVGPSLRVWPGVHSYELRWETDRRVRFGPLEDEIPWDVTGSDWAVPIREASVLVRMEGLAEPLALEARAGARGERAVPVRAEGPGAAATEPVPLAPGEGLSIRVTLPKWTVHAVSYHKEREWFWLDWRGWIEALVCVLAVVALYVAMWWRVGRDRPDPVAVQYEPPRGLSAAAVGFLHRRRFHRSQYAAAIVSLGVKGALRLRRDAGRWRLERVGPGSGLTSDERAVLGALLGSERSVALEPGSASHLAAGASVLGRALSAQLERAFLVANLRWWLAGIAGGALALGVLAWRWRHDVEAGTWGLVVMLDIFTLVAVSLLARAWASLRHGRAGGGTLALVQGGFVVMVSLPFALLTLALAQAVNEMAPGHLLAAGVAIGATHAIFYHLLQRPTRAGRAVLNRVEGFRRFLSAVDRDRLRTMLGREPTTEVAERFLPHAIALGVEEVWAARLGALLTPPAGMDGGIPAECWVQGDGIGVDGAALASALGESLPDALGTREEGGGACG